MTSADLTALLKKHPIGFGCAFLSIACGVFLYLTAGSVAEVQAQLDEKSGEATKMANNIRNSANLPEQLAEIQTHTKELEARLLKGGQLAVNLQYFFKLEAETEVKMIDVRPGALPKGAKTTYIGIPFNVSVQGTYAQVTNFLGRLQNGRHFCRINTANFAKSNNPPGPNGPLITLTLNLELLGQP